MVAWNSTEGGGHSLLKKNPCYCTVVLLPIVCPSKQCCPKANSKTTSLWWILRSAIAESKDIMLKVFDEICQSALLKCCANSQTHWSFMRMLILHHWVYSKHTPKLCQLGKLMRLSYIPHHGEIPLVSWKLCHENIFYGATPGVYVNHCLNPQHHQIFI